MLLGLILAAYTVSLFLLVIQHRCLHGQHDPRRPSYLVSVPAFASVFAIYNLARSCMEESRPRSAMCAAPAPSVGRALRLETDSIPSSQASHVSGRTWHRAFAKGLPHGHALRYRECSGMKSIRHAFLARSRDISAVQQSQLPGVAAWLHAQQVLTLRRRQLSLSRHGRVSFEPDELRTGEWSRRKDQQTPCTAISG
jgi:hypothetical protein